MRIKSMRRVARASLVGLLLFPAIGISATTDELERRLQNLEGQLNAAKDEIAINHEESVDAADRIRNAMAIGGYADVEYFTTNEANKDAGFRLHHLSLMFKKRISDKLKFFSEIEFEDGVWQDGTKGSNKIFLEAINFDYAVTHSTTIRVGRFFTPAGIWSVDHYPPFVTTQERPLHIRNIFPQLTDGMSIIGNRAVGKSFLNYDFFVGNGETKDFNGKYDRNSSLATGLRMNVSLPFANVFDLGATYYREKMKAEISGADVEPKKRAFGVHAKIKQGRFGFQSEIATGHYTPTAPAADSYRNKGYYGQFTYDIAKWTVGYRADYYDKKTNVDLDSTKINSLFANYHLDRSTVLKLEHHLVNNENPATKDYYKNVLSIAVSFD